MITKGENAFRDCLFLNYKENLVTLVVGSREPMEADASVHRLKANSDPKRNTTYFPTKYPDKNAQSLTNIAWAATAFIVPSRDIFHASKPPGTQRPVSGQRIEQGRLQFEARMAQQNGYVNGLLRLTRAGDA